MPQVPTPLPSQLGGRPFTVREARVSEVREGRLRRKDLAAPYWGVRAPAMAPDLRDDCLAALTFLPAGTAVSHWTALRLSGVALPAPLEHDPVIHVRLPPGSGRVRRRGVVAHHSSRTGAVQDLAGVPVVTAEQGWTDCAGTLDGDSLVVVGDGLLRRRDPLTSLDALKNHVEGLRGRSRGAARLRSALPYLRPRTDSPMETRARLVLVRGGLPCPEVNELVHDAAGHFLAMPDMLYRAARVAIEYDGDVHRTERRVWRRDVERRNLLQSAGWLVVTATADVVVHHPAALLRHVNEALRSRR